MIPFSRYHSNPPVSFTLSQYTVKSPSTFLYACQQHRQRTAIDTDGA
jgi:hypothetical protein